ncbi:MAG: hypothetical protein WBZ36_04385 [Candidatus Nitrosopolaris sp.]
MICNLVNGAPVRTRVIWQVFKQLRLRIQRLVGNGSIADEQRRQKLEYLLKTKKWNPYCIRHSAITDDSDHLPDFALKKKVRWSMNSRQGKRYIKHRMGDELKNKILEHTGIKLTTPGHPVSVQRTCGRCGYVNKLESKYCEKVGCNYPLTQLALDEIKAAEEAKLQTLRNELLETKAAQQKKDSEMQVLKEQIEEIRNLYQDLIQRNTFVRNLTSIGGIE